MRPLKPAGPDPDSSAFKHLNNSQSEVSFSSSSGKAVPAAGHSKANRPYRFRTDSWLSTKDANFLLKKRASWEAQQQNYTTAIQLLNKLVAYEPDNAENYANRGLMHSHMQAWTQALADYNQALELNPELDKVYNNRANLYATCHNWAAAIADYNAAIDINPLNIRARLNQAITCREMGHYEEALNCLEVAMFFRPESAFLYAERGRAYHLRGDWNCAIADYSTALTLTEKALTQNSDQNTSGSSLGHPSKINRRVKDWMNSLTS